MSKIIIDTRTPLHKSTSHIIGANRNHLSGEKNLAGKLAAYGAMWIANGIIEPEPLERECLYCDYASICAWRQGEKGIKSPAVKPEDFCADDPRGLMNPSVGAEENEERYVD